MITVLESQKLVPNSFSNAIPQSVTTDIYDLNILCAGGGLPGALHHVENGLYLLESSVLVAQSSLTPCHPMDHSPPGSSVHGILQARMLEWVVICFSIRA